MYFEESEQLDFKSNQYMPYGGGGLVSNGDLMFAYSEMDDKNSYPI